MSKKRGFSILEVLIAVSIMGIIAGISMPNYTKMKRSAKKAEAQSSLGQVYIAEKAFFLQWRYYTVDLVRIGAIPEGALTYNVGFHGEGELNSKPADYNGPGVKKENNNFFAICGKDFEGADGEVKQCAFSYKKKGQYTGFSPPDIPEKTAENKAYDAKKNTFIAGAIANLIKKNNKSSTDKNDIWSINQFKQVNRECGDSCPY